MGEADYASTKQSFEKAYPLAEALADDFLQRYELGTGNAKPAQGQKYDSHMGDWSNLLRSKKAPKNKEELVAILEKIIEEVHNEHVVDPGLDEMYNSYFDSTAEIHPSPISLAKTLISKRLAKRIE